MRYDADEVLARLKMVEEAMSPELRLRHELNIQRLELKAAVWLATQTPESLAAWERGYRQRSEAFAAQQRELREYHRETKAAREQHHTPPPHPIHNPEAWQRWRYTKASQATRPR